MMIWQLRNDPQHSTLCGKDMMKFSSFDFSRKRGSKNPPTCPLLYPHWPIAQRKDQSLLLSLPEWVIPGKLRSTVD
jgi:hypothetical protein